MQFYNPYNNSISILVPNWLMQRKEVSIGAKLCYGRLCQYADEDGKCSVSEGTLAEDLGVSIRQVRRYIQELQDKKLIFIEKKGKINCYYFLVHEWMEDTVSALSDIKEAPSIGLLSETSEEKTNELEDKPTNYLH